ncbi:histidinol-phosphate transaminase [Bradymonadaceae bacterium TMQ3]|uniref:Histidinol-phosphate aminotransferase n=1 Tax=Lujinxingia sediminis TaxID=2480984 RepID=A0ABY0CSQ2_9DELT|nr:histidinol-phosphate transaminase [Lujinxingia sediminis]RDV38890.1 histidinol-phosphate transaminase [Bradymonadaceae bacterium TMQ3]RVU44124.1 histidinol-phosphate transaminase [Lujinxingia sediminis]TXC76338.1 histidinol-phosphate transaminase [Bradymonadales bacterium TMQ1]
MKALVGEHIETLKPYVPGKPIEELERELGIEGSIKLASNENPLGPSPMATEAARALLSKGHIYPDGAAHRLRAAVAEFHGVNADEVITGNGSNEVLTIAVRTFCTADDEAVVSEYSFAAYPIICQAQGMTIRRASMKEPLTFDLEAMAAAITPKTKIVFVANPNNPTGTYVPADELRTFLKAVPEDVIVVVDEAYHEYVQADDYASAETMRDLRERLIICRTFSKCYGLAGIRAGYGIAPANLIDRMNRVREPFNVNILAQDAAAAALKDVNFVERSVRINEEGRAILEKGLAEMSELGVSWIPSQTNFLLVKTPVEGVSVYNALLRKGVIVRPMAGYGLGDYVRISIGTPDEVRRCLKSLGEVLPALVNGEGA